MIEQGEFVKDQILSQLYSAPMMIEVEAIDEPSGDGLGVDLTRGSHFRCVVLQLKIDLECKLIVEVEVKTNAG